MDEKRATPKQIRDFFEKDGGSKVPLSELQELKKNGGKDYDEIATGIGNGSMTY